MVQSKGKALGHFLRWNPYSEEPRTPKTDSWEWSDIPESSDLRNVYDYLTSEKLAHLRGEREESSQRVTASEAKNMVEKAKEEAQTETRNELLSSVYESTDVTQKELAESVGLSRSRLADIV